MDTPFDCQTCGACCVSPWHSLGYVRLDQADVERLRTTGLPIITQEQPGWDGVPEQLVRLGTRQDRRERRVCVALGGAAGDHCSCGVYGLRPDACRRYEAGSSLCRSARQRLGLPV
jgi:Fe-S-cluster containining protein